MNDPSLWVGSGVALVLLGLTAFFNAAEVALLAVNKLRMRGLAEEGSRRAKLVMKLSENPSEYLSVLIVCITISVICGSSLIAFLADMVFQKNQYSDLLILVSTLFWAALVIIFAEIVPKAFAASFPNFFALNLAGPTQFFVWFVSPLVKVFTKLANILMIPLKMVAKAESQVVTEEEIKMMVSMGEEEGVLQEAEREMIHSVIEFGDTIVREIMTPRVDVVCVEQNASLDDILEIILTHGHSRIPVYEETIDKIEGFVHAKDVMRYFKEHDREFSLIRIERPVLMVPETKKVAELFHEMRKTKKHVAIVLDEFGGTSGLVTIEDLLEEIVGEIQDEYDAEEPVCQLINKNSALVDAKMNIEEANKVLEMELPLEEGFDTIGGFIYSHLGHVPSEGEEMKWKNISLKVERTNGNRIEKVHILKEELPENVKDNGGKPEDRV